MMNENEKAVIINLRDDFLKRMNIIEDKLDRVRRLLSRCEIAKEYTTKKYFKSTPDYHYVIHSNGDIEVLPGPEPEHLTDYIVAVQRFGDSIEYESWYTSAKNDQQAIKQIMQDRPNGRSINTTYYLELNDDE